MKPRTIFKLYIFAGLCFAIAAIFYISNKKYYLAATNFALCLSLFLFAISYSKKIKK